MLRVERKRNKEINNNNNNNNNVSVYAIYVPTQHINIISRQQNLVEGSETVHITSVCHIALRSGRVNIT
jgi:hypothetical protein